MFSPAPVSAAAQLAVHLGGGGQIAKAVGEVFLCSGQSNMERTVDYIVNASSELAAAAHPLMRLFQVPSVSPPGPRARGTCPRVSWTDRASTALTTRARASPARAARQRRHNETRLTLKFEMYIRPDFICKVDFHRRVSVHVLD